jgi:hypothetical protein
MEELRLDGNAAGGILREVFAHDVTDARATCVGCGDARAIGALLAYGHGMGVVLRCPGCDAVMLRVMRSPTHVGLDATGIRLLVIPDAGPVA